jgi:nicotinate-nucleotide adenylyltransferase
MDQRTTSRPRVAFFGGSFDPPHLGHLAVARAAQAALGLDTVLFAPVGAQPLKPRGSTASFDDRLAMTRLAIAGQPGFAVSLADAPRPSGAPNYTIDTLLGLRTELPPDPALFCLMGADAFAGLRRWHRAAEIPFAASLIVASRPGQSLGDLAAALPEGVTLEDQSFSPDLNLEELAGVAQAAEKPVALKGHDFSRAVSAAISTRASAPEGCFSPISPEHIELRCYALHNSAGEQAPLYLLPNLEIEISASEIREQVRAASGGPVPERELLPAPVSAYIRAHGLYRDLPQSS